METKKKARVATLIPGRTDFKQRAITEDRESYYIVIKVSTQKEDITSVKYLCTKHKSA